MESLRQKQSRFVRMTIKLLNYAHEMGYEVTFGDAYRDDRCPYGSSNSLHRLRLAIDLNLFDNGRYLERTEDHRRLGEYWESIGGRWGGRFSDGNHYELPR